MNRPNHGRLLPGVSERDEGPCRSIPDLDVAFGESGGRSFLDAPQQSQAMLDAIAFAHHRVARRAGHFP